MRYPRQEQSREIPSQIFAHHNDEVLRSFNVTDQSKLNGFDQSSVHLKHTPVRLNETDTYPQGRVRNIMSTETDESRIYNQQHRVNTFLQD